MIKQPLKHLHLPLLLCSSVLLSACDNSPNSTTANNPMEQQDQIMQEFITEPVKAFEKTPDDPHDIALLNDFDTRFTQMSDDMEDELNRMQEAGELSDEFAHNRKRDNVQSALNMLKDLDLKTEQGRYIQGLIAEYWQTQAKLYHAQTTTKTDKIELSQDQVKDLGGFLHAQEQLEYWQSQYPAPVKATTPQAGR